MKISRNYVHDTCTNCQWSGNEWLAECPSCGQAGTKAKDRSMAIADLWRFANALHPVSGIMAKKVISR